MTWRTKFKREEGGVVVWKSPPARWQQGEECVAWTDIQSPNSGMRGVVIDVELIEKEEKILLLSRAVVFGGLPCLGPHQTRTNSAGNRAVFFIHGNYFALGDGDEDDEWPQVARSVYLGAFEPHRVLSSYGTGLLSRLLRAHRAMHTRCVTNAHLKEKLRLRGVTDAAHMDRDRLAAEETAAATGDGDPPRSLRQQVFSTQVKRPLTRLREMHLRARVERLRLRNELHRNERDRLQAEVDDTRRRIDDIKVKVSDTNVVLMSKIHVLSKDKATFSRWEERLASNAKHVTMLRDVLASCQLNVLHSFQFLYPIQDCDEGCDGKAATIRWISLPRVEDAKSRSSSEIMQAVTAGWISEMVVIFAAVLDVPLRYPVRLFGSNSSIVDHRQPAAMGTDFPLHVKGSDVTRAEYGVFLLQKNLAQLRWICGLQTSEFRLSLKNLYELMVLKEKRMVQPALAAAAVIDSAAAAEEFSLALSPPPGCYRGAPSVQQHIATSSPVRRGVASSFSAAETQSSASASASAASSPGTSSTSTAKSRKGSIPSSSSNESGANGIHSTSAGPETAIKDVAVDTNGSKGQKAKPGSLPAASAEPDPCFHLCQQRHP